jgi:hypothetical protein
VGDLEHVEENAELDPVGVGSYRIRLDGEPFREPLVDQLRVLRRAIDDLGMGIRHCDLMEILVDGTLSFLVCGEKLDLDLPTAFPSASFAR